MFILKDVDTKSQDKRQTEMVKKLVSVVGVIIGV